jgi:hypothetical protein
MESSNIFIDTIQFIKDMRSNPREGAGNERSNPR